MKHAFYDIYLVCCSDAGIGQPYLFVYSFMLR